MPKINKTLFITNLKLNIVTLNNFFGKLVFSGETAKNWCRGPHWGSKMCNNFQPIRIYVTGILNLDPGDSQNLYQPDN